MGQTTVEQNQKGRIEALEELLERIDDYLDNHRGIARDSLCHLEIKLVLGRAEYGERVIYALDFGEDSEMSEFTKKETE